MTKLEALKALAEKVEAGEAIPYEIEKDALAVWLGGAGGVPRWLIADNARRAYGGSLDAAKALHEDLLPGWSAWYETNLGVSVKRDGEKIWQNLVPFLDNPARAWLLAIIRALIEQEGSE